MLNWKKKLEQGKRRLSQGLDVAMDAASGAKDQIEKVSDKVVAGAKDLKESTSDKFNELKSGAVNEYKIFKGSISECEEVLNALEAADDDFEVVGTCSIGADDMAVTIKLKG